MHTYYQCTRCGGLVVWAALFGEFVHVTDGTHDFVDHLATPAEGNHPTWRR